MASPINNTPHTTNNSFKHHKQQGVQKAEGKTKVLLSKQTVKQNSKCHNDKIAHSHSTLHTHACTRTHACTGWLVAGVARANTEGQKAKSTTLRANKQTNRGEKGRKEGRRETETEKERQRQRNRERTDRQTKEEKQPNPIPSNNKHRHNDPTYAAIPLPLFSQPFTLKAPKQL